MKVSREPPSAHPPGNHTISGPKARKPEASSTNRMMACPFLPSGPTVNIIFLLTVGGPQREERRQAGA